MARTLVDNPLFKKTDSGDFGIVHLPIGVVQPSPHQARKAFSDESIAELAESIRTVGMLQPIKVVKDGNAYHVVYGERRLRALKSLGIAELLWDSRSQLATIPEPPNADLAVQSLTENILRENLSPIEEAEAYQHLRNLKGFKKQQQLAEYMGIDKRRISEKLQLLELSDKIKQELLGKAGAVTASHARELMKLEDEELQLQVIKRVADQGLSVKETSRIVSDMRRRMLDAGQTRDGSEATEFRRRIEERKFIRRFDQLCRQLLQAAKIVSEGNGQLKTAFLDTFGNDDSVLAALEKTLREMREGKQD
ncbi:MAG TPA: ParB/RepB/Spo0J family partition protein [Planctomycetota bacterium]|nr:ParB/RepB/Spo0J family partition protein [Planctomycetota bacterium]